MVRHLILVYALLGLNAFAQTSTSDLIRADEQKRLQTCLELQETDPEDAYEFALAWQGEGRTYQSQYCAATGLIALGKHEEGAIRLEELAISQTLPISLKERGVYMAQAGNAWLLANLPDQAIVALTEAIKLEKFDANLYLDRARAYLAQKHWKKGEEDLAEAIKIQPGDLQAYILRGRARLAQDKLDDAWADVEQGMAIDITNVDLLVLRGDVREAKRLAAAED